MIPLAMPIGTRLACMSVKGNDLSMTYEYILLKHQEAWIRLTTQAL